MNTSGINSTSTWSDQSRRPLPAIATELVSREPRLAWFGAVLLMLVLPMGLMVLFDERSLRDANVWIKPIKFALSIALFAWTTAWWIGHLPARRRSGRAVDVIVWLLIGTGTFEFAYITLQAALGQASHYNIGDALHATMYSLMGLAALGLTASQAMLAWQLFRFPDRGRPAAMRAAVLVGLTLTFVLGTAVGGLLSGMQPPSGGPAVPLFGWALGGGDLRPAHFVGIHAHQLLPLAGFAAVARYPGHARSLVLISTLVYCGVFVALTVWGLAGRY